MKKILLCLGVAIMSYGTSKAQYCIPTYATGTGDGDYIGMVQLGSINVTTGGAPSPFYTYDVVNTTTLAQGVSYTITLSCGTYGTNDIAAWIDYNQDGIFDVSEKLGETDNMGAFPATTAYTFTVPGGATLGVTRLRVREFYAGAPGIDPCNAATYGEVEDFDVTIIAGTDCTGMPTAGTASAPAGVCGTDPYTVTLSGYTSGVTGIGIQWQNSPDGITFTNIPGATSSSYTTNMAGATVYYQAVVNCTPSGMSSTSNIVSVAPNAPTLCYCTTGLHISSSPCINNVTIEMINNNSSGCALPSYTSYPTTTATTDLMQGMISPISVTTDGDAILSVWIDYDHSGTYDPSEWEQIATTTSAGVADVINIFIPTTSLTGPTGMRIRARATSNPNGAGDACLQFGSGETEDYTVNIIPAPACTGTPDAGAAVTSDNGVCSGETASLSLSGSTAATGLTYQWQESPDGVTFTNIAGGDTLFYDVMPTDTTYYQCVVTCTATGMSDISDVVVVNFNPFYLCYCNANLYSYTYPCIENVTLEDINNSHSGCGMPGWTYFAPSATTTTDLEQLVNYPVSVTDDGDAIVSMWIDYDHSGTFDASEWTQITTMSNYMVPSSSVLNIPNTALLGPTGMRVRTTYYYNSNGPTDACTYFYGGETEDYTVNILPAPPCVNVPVGGTLSGPAADSLGNLGVFALSGNNGDNVMWYVSTDGGMTYNLIAGETNDTLNYTFVTATDPMFYAVSSSPGCVSAVSDTVMTNIIVNDNACEAFPLVVGVNGPYSTQGFTVEPGETGIGGYDCQTQMTWCNPTLDATAWFTIVAPASGRISIHSPDFDSQLALWKANDCHDLTAGLATLIAANDDDSDYVDHGGVQYSSFINGIGYCLTPGATYYLQLDAYSGYGTTAIVITDLGAPSSPTVDIQDSVYCSGSVVMDAGAGTGLTYVWSNGDSTQTTTFTTTGMVSITIIDSLNCHATDSAMVTNNMPNADFGSATPSLGVYNFTNSSTPSSSITGYNWNFGDGGNSTLEDPNHTYTSNGVYIVTLVVTNSCGTDATTQTVVVNGIGISELNSDHSVKVYPNPASDLLNITSDVNINEISVVNTAGQRVLNLNNVNSNKALLDLGNLGSGMYMVNVQTANGTAHTQISVMK